MRIIIDGEELEAKGLLEAPKYAVQALQRQTGLTMAELYKKGNDTEDLDREVFTAQVVEFLTEHSRGNRVTWKELAERPVPIILPDAIDEARAEQEGEDDQGPTRARTDSPADAAPAAHALKPKTRKSNGSSKKSRGSKGKSTSGSSTSSTSSPG